MIVYRLHTNEGTFYRRRKPTNMQMYDYIREKRIKNYPLSAIIFCWTLIHVG